MFYSEQGSSSRSAATHILGAAKNTKIRMDEKVIFQLFKDIIIAQNKAFLRDLALKFNRNPEDFTRKYLKPEYYLPIIDRQ